MIGLELDETCAIAVRIDDHGAVQARARVDAAGDLAAATAAALARVQSAPADPVGVAATNPDAPAIAPVVSGLANRLAGKAGVAMSGSAAAAAETWVGAARGAQDVVFFAVGQHTTGGFVRGGVVIHGTRGRAGSIAWLALNPVEREDYRKTGCLEAEVAAAGLVRRLIWRIKAGDRSRVQDLVKDDLTAITVDHLLDAARGGDGVSISVVRDTAKYLGMAAANLVVVADPEMLVLGGSWRRQRSAARAVARRAGAPRAEADDGRAAD